MGVLDGKAVVITGGGRGIGAATARLAAREGAAVVVNDIDADVAEEVAGEITSAGGTAVAVPADVSVWAEAGRLIDACVSTYGAIDGLFNNAGLFAMATVLEQEEHDLRRMVETNIMGVYGCAVHAIAHMVRQGRGSVVSSTSGAHCGIPMMGAYAATKGAVASMTYSWALDLAGTAVRVNCLSPLARTRMAWETTNAYTDAHGLARFPDETPDPSVNSPVVVYLFSDAASSIKGQIVRIEKTQLALLTHPAVLTPVLSDPEWTIEKVGAAFDSVLADRQVPLGIVGIEASYVGTSSEFWSHAAAGK